jgi:class 3 adenylate cyclase
MKFRILGPLEVDDGGRQLVLGAAKQRSLLGVLLLHPNEAVSSDRLIDELWGERPPARAAKVVQGHVSALRKLLGADRIVTQPPGYLVRVADGELDLFEFERAVAQARSGEAAEAAELLREALALWRAPALSDVSLEGLAAREVERLNELRLATRLERIEADLALGRHAGLLGELETLIAQHPLQERPRGQLMLALYRSGRQAEALALYRATRALLADELGLEPSQELQRLERQMLTHDPELDLTPAPPVVGPAPAPAPTEASARVRRLISVVFADLVGSTTLADRLDPETLHGVLARYSERCADVLEAHGGTVEKFIGDAVVGVFGLPSLHEDDALRAVRAAVEIRQAAAALSGELEREWSVGIDVKVAVNSGEVFAGAGDRREAFASGDALNIAAQLERAAAAGDILLGEQTHQLVAHAVQAEPLEPLTVEGRSAAVRAWRLVELLPEEAQQLRSSATRFVGRKRELAELEEALERNMDERGCRLLTVLGPPGIGKSRLTRELIELLGDGATVVVGRCASYGEGITYRPLIEIVRRLGGDDPEALLGELLEGDERADLIVRLVLGAVGLAETEGQTEDIAWGFRRLLEALARARPLVAVFEDVHWAEPTLLDLLEYVAGFSTGAPILLLCLARPELLEQRPSWAVPQPSRTLLALEPLPAADARELVDQLGSGELGEHARARIVETAEGNPLFLEQLVAAQAEDGTTALPASVQAVLAARLDRLAPAERAVLERASVEGLSFHRGALAELMRESELRELGPHLITLVAKQLVRPDRPELPGEDAFRFAHVLIREAAYEGMSKLVRADLHERLAAWLEPKPEAGDEIVGYHLEQAYRLRAELAPVDEPGRDLGRRAASRLLAAGRAARSRGDATAAVNLLERAGALIPAADEVRVQAQPELAGVLLAMGEYERAAAVLNEAIEVARRAGDERAEAHTLLGLASLRIKTDPAHDMTGLRAEAERLISVFERLGDDDGLARAWLELGTVRFWLGSCAAATEAYTRALDFAGRVSNRSQTRDILSFLGWATIMGPLPAAEGIRRLDEIRRHPDCDGAADASVLACRAILEAMQGRFEQPRSDVRASRSVLRDHGLLVDWAGHSTLSGWIELLAGDPAAAEREVRGGYEALQRMGETGFLSNVAAVLAEAVRAQGRLEEAVQLSVVSERAAARDVVEAQALWRRVRARVLAARGEAAEAERLARESVSLIEPTDLLHARADSFAALAEVLRLIGRPDEAGEPAHEAQRLYELKGDIVSARLLLGVA